MEKEPLTNEWQLADMHCHLGFAADAAQLLRASGASGAAALSCTVLPAEFERDAEAFAGLPRVRVGLGLHPWQVAEGAGESELRRFEQLAAATPFIGEVGLDFAGERGSEAGRCCQLEAFDRVLAACDEPAACAAAARKLISVHAVRAAGEVLDAFEAHGTLQRHAAIFHWFSGTPEQLKRAAQAGCFFSVGPRMLRTKRGREYARIIPEGQLLLETDSPAQPGQPWGVRTWRDQLEESLEQLARIRAVDAGQLQRTLAETSSALLRL